ncbi:hypothetical protein Vafri_273 [Volvox africanus]|nr:hypothetical protein Vafri_273 [Volvox africanus]GIL42229.1 hypothetical protein Vafri_273 [Volvox africanus]
MLSFPQMLCPLLPQPAADHHGHLHMHSTKLSRHVFKTRSGTSLEQSGPDPASDVYRRHVAPILAVRKDLWPGLEAAEAADRGADPGLTAFLRAAGLVQSRAFHLEAENWVSGAKEISRLEDGGTQVFLLPGIDMINHSHNPARRNAHLERLNLAQAAAAKLLDGAASAEAPSLPAGVEAVFVMRAGERLQSTGAKS